MEGHWSLLRKIKDPIHYLAALLRGILDNFLFNPTFFEQIKVFKFYSFTCFKKALEDWILNLIGKID